MTALDPGRRGEIEAETLKAWRAEAERGDIGPTVGDSTESVRRILRLLDRLAEMEGALEREASRAADLNNRLARVEALADKAEAWGRRSLSEHGIPGASVVTARALRAAIAGDA